MRRLFKAEAKFFGDKQKIIVVDFLFFGLFVHGF